jgi:hypothetical protein
LATFNEANYSTQIYEGIAYHGMGTHRQEACKISEPWVFRHVICVVIISLLAIEPTGVRFPLAKVASIRIYSLSNPRRRLVRTPEPPDEEKRTTMRWFTSTAWALAVGSTIAAARNTMHYEMEPDLRMAPRTHSARGLPAPSKKGAMLMNRIGPSSSELYVANIDGSNERKLLGNNSAFEYHASFSADGQWVTFTSERNGDGNSDFYRCRTDGTGLEKLVGTPSVEDAGVLSPDSSQVAWVSTANVYTTNIWEWT